MPVASNSPEAKMVSPFENLNNQLSNNNGQFTELLARLSNTLHRLSNTNIPEPENPNKESEPDLPFRDGHLKNYYYDINRYKFNLVDLEKMVSKIEQLV